MQTQTVTPETTSDWLTVPEAAATLRTGRRSVYRAIDRGELRAAKINERGDLRIARVWLMDWCERRAVRS
jgi:excisionase family DNA binding protein